jgi:hypothetical protein
MTYLEPKDSVHALHAKFVYQATIKFILKERKRIRDLLGTTLSPPFLFRTEDLSLN